MRAPLGVRIYDGAADRYVSRFVTGLSFRKTAPGGHTAAAMRINRPGDTFRDLGPADRVFVSDPQGRSLWEGYVENPGRLDGIEGEGFDLSALGSVVRATDESRTLIYRDSDLTSWSQQTTSAASASASTSDDPTASPGATASSGLLCQFNPGQPIGSGSLAQIGYDGLTDTGMTVGALQVRIRSGKTDIAYRNDLMWSAPGTSGSVSLGTISTTQSAILARYAGGGVLPTGQTAVALQLRRAGGATNVADDDTWSFFDEIAVLGHRVTRFGVAATATEMQPAAHLLPHVVVEDLLGRLLACCDPYSAVVEAGTYEIDQLAYTDGANASEVLDQLVEWEPDFLWSIGASTGNGFRFEWRKWPTTPRYEISTRDAYDAPGGDLDLCNRIAVFWTNRRGVKRTTVVTATSGDFPGLKALEDENRVRDADPITLPDGLGSPLNAQRVGLATLLAKADPPVSATAVVKSRIYDGLMGCWVEPWAIEPGYMVRVRETGDLLRLTEMEYDDDAGSTSLQLGTPVLTDEQRIARLAQRKRVA